MSRAEVSKQGKEIENLKKKMSALDAVKQGLEADKDKLNQELNKKSKVRSRSLTRSRRLKPGAKQEVEG